MFKKLLQKIFRVHSPSLEMYHAVENILTKRENKWLTAQIQLFISSTPSISGGVDLCIPCVFNLLYGTVCLNYCNNNGTDRLYFLPSNNDNIKMLKILNRVAPILGSDIDGDVLYITYDSTHNQAKINTWGINTNES